MIGRLVAIVLGAGRSASAWMSWSARPAAGKPAPLGVTENELTDAIGIAGRNVRSRYRRTETATAGQRTGHRLTGPGLERSGVRRHVNTVGCQVSGVG